MRQRISYAQNGEDVRAWRALRHVEDGFYVEVGASHPYDDSLTAALSAEGWRGVLVEAEPAAAEVLRAARPRDVVVAAAAHSEPGVLTWVDEGERGRGSVTASEPVDAVALSVPAVRLADVLDELAPEQLHFLSVDVEGHEQHALAGLDLSRWRPWVLCVEATEPGSRATTQTAWEPLVLGAGYRFAAFDGLNRWYVAAEHPELAEAVAEPFGVLDTMLDGWVRREVVQLRKQVAGLTHGNDRLVEEVRQAEAETARLRREFDLAVTARDAALARERVMLESKSWRLTAPLRRARSKADTTLAQRALARPAPAAPPAPRVTTPADLRRRRALAAKLAAAQERERG